MRDNSKKKILVAVILLMAVGFASIATTLYINGNARIQANLENFRNGVIFTAADANGKGSAEILDSGKSITYVTSTLSTKDETAVLDYTITNFSTIYDANVTIECLSTDETNRYNEYITYNLDKDSYFVEATKSVDGYLTVQLKKVTTDDHQIGLVCTITAEAVERTTAAEPIVDSLGNKYLYKYVQGLTQGSDKTANINYRYSTHIDDNPEYNGFGVYTVDGTENNDYPIYFYRGPATINNTVVFANKCWSILRTTETGGTKLMYRGEYANGACSYVNNDPLLANQAYNGYIYGNENGLAGYMFNVLGAYSYELENANVYDSNAKKQLDLWYETYLLNTGFDNYIEDTVFCNDRSVYLGSGYGGEKTMYNGGYRFYGESTASEYGSFNHLDYNHVPEPSLTCAQNNDKFTVSSSLGNGALTYPIGLVTMDEMVYSGTSPISNEEVPFTVYDYGNWRYGRAITMTPESYAGDVRMFVPYSNYMSTGYTTNLYNDTYELRPVISLKNNVTIKSGAGSDTNPFILDTVSHKVTFSLLSGSGKIPSNFNVIDGVDYTIKLKPAYNNSVNELNINRSNISTNDKSYNLSNIDDDISVGVTYQANNEYVAHNEKLYDRVQSLVIDDDRQLNFNYSGNNELGVYLYGKSKNNNYPIYFYRGNVTDNNLIYNGFCWKIVRTTETGGTKLIYNGVPSNGKCNNSETNAVIEQTNYNDNNQFVDGKYVGTVYGNGFVGYMYGTLKANSYELEHANLNDSTVKISVDNWYKNNLLGTTDENMIEDTVYCNERTVTHCGISGGSESRYGQGFGDSNAYAGYAASRRLYDSSTSSSANTNSNNPVLECFQNNDKFTKSPAIGNGKLTYPIGLITGDEAMLAGGWNYNNYNTTDSYLSNVSEFWTMTPSYSSAQGAYVYVFTNKKVDWRTTGFNPSFGVRPVISLKNSTIITSGIGSIDNPYIVG